MQRQMKWSLGLNIVLLSAYLVGYVESNVKTTFMPDVEAPTDRSTYSHSSAGRGYRIGHDRRPGICRADGLSSWGRRPAYFHRQRQ